MRLWHALKAAFLLSALAPGAVWAAPFAAWQEGRPSAVVYAVDGQGFPTVIAYLAVSDAQGRPVAGLTPADIQLLARNPDEVAISGISAGTLVALADPEKKETKK